MSEIWLAPSEPSPQLLEIQIEQSRALWPTKGFVTLNQILGKHGGPIPCGKTTFWAKVKTGEFPKPLKVAGRTVWRVSDIDALIANLEQQNTK